MKLLLLPIAVILLAVGLSACGDSKQGSTCKNIAISKVAIGTSVFHVHAHRSVHDGHHVAGHVLGD